ncbi:trypsin-like serine protease [Bradyrhizobium sp. 146]|nr:trypsin-like serine protease [Bradyrhizobium sp. 146]
MRWQSCLKFFSVMAATICLQGISMVAGRADEDDLGLSVEDDAAYRVNAEAIKNSKVWGGVPVAKGAYPAIVGITQAGRRQVQCTGSLIESDLVLTAAHCVCGGITGSVVFADREGTGSSIKVAASTHRSNSCGGALTNGSDVGLLLLSQKASVSPLEMQTDETVQAATSYQVVGFGGYGLDSSGQLLAGQKRETTVPSGTNDCKGTVPGSSRTYASAFGCAPGAEIVAGKTGLGRDTCNGDSGGPILAGPAGTVVGQTESALKLAGTTSRATKSARVPCGDGGIYVRLTPEVRQWITQASKTLRQK